MSKLLVGLAALLAAAVVAAPATANEPNGKGHVITYGVPCAGGEPVLIRLTRPLGKSAWVVDTDQHYVVSAFGITSTFTPTGGGAPVVDSYFNTFGNKVGLGEPVICQGSFSEEVEGGTLETTITGHIHYLQPDK